MPEPRQDAVMTDTEWKPYRLEPEDIMYVPRIRVRPSVSVPGMTEVTCYFYTCTMKLKKQAYECGDTYELEQFNAASECVFLHPVVIPSIHVLFPDKLAGFQLHEAVHEIAPDDEHFKDQVARSFAELGSKMARDFLKHRAVIGQERIIRYGVKD